MSSPEKPRFVASENGPTPTEARRSLVRRLAIVLPVPIIAGLVFLQGKKADPTLKVVAEGAALDAEGRLQAPAGATAALRFSDGTFVELAPGSRVRVEATAVLGGRLSLEAGQLSAHVAAPSPMARWFFAAGPLEIVSPGGALTFARGAVDGQFEFTLREGQAKVRAPELEAGLDLRTDERVSVDLNEGVVSRLPLPGTSVRALQAVAFGSVRVDAAGNASEDAAPLAPSVVALSAAPGGAVVHVTAPRGQRPQARLVPNGSDPKSVRLQAGALPGDPRFSGPAALDGTHVFAAVTQTGGPGAGQDAPSRGVTWQALRRLSHDGAPAPFPGGRGADKSLVVIDPPSPAAVITAVARGGDSVYVGLAAEKQRRGVLLVLARDSLAEGARVEGSAPRALAAAEGRLFVADGSDDVQVLDAQANIVGHARMPGPVTALAAAGPRVFVAHGGSAPGVTSFAAKDPLSTERVVVPAGFSPLTAPTALAADEAGALHMLSSVGPITRIVSRTADGVWFARLSPAADSAPTLDTDGTIYSSAARFRRDNARVSFAGFTLDPVQFPEDGRARSSAVDGAVMHIAGAKVLVDAATPSRLALYRFAAGGWAVPALTFGFGAAPGLPQEHPARQKPAWLWRDADGDGHPKASEYEGVDLPVSWGSALADDGSLLWASATDGIEVVPFAGFDDRGVPAFNLAARTRIPHPAQLKRVRRVIPGPKGVVYLSGDVGGAPHDVPNEEDAPFGTDLLRFDDFRGSSRLRWQRQLVVDNTFGRRAVGVAVAEQHVFVMFAHDPTIHTLDAATGMPTERLQIAGDDSAPFDPARAVVPVRATEGPSGLTLLVSDPLHARAWLLRPDR